MVGKESLVDWGVTVAAVTVAAALEEATAVVATASGAY